MRHCSCAAVIGVLSAAIFAPVNSSHAASADPSGYWMKPDAERESKIQVLKCGSGRTQLCAKIVWLKEPNDSKGQPLHDVRNEDPSRRGRTIVGLQLFTGFTPSAPGTWNGSIYNPEDGHTYTATLTLVSRNQITLRGCKAWLLCGEKQWLRTSAPPEVTPSVPAEGSQQIEASAEPQTPSTAAPAAALAATEPVAPSGEAKTANAPVEAAAPNGDVKTANAPIEAAAEPAAEVKTVKTPIEASAAPDAIPLPVSAKAAIAEPAPKPEPAATSVQAMPVEAPAEIGARNGYRFLTVSTDPDTAARLSDENVSNMFFVTKPVATKTVEPVPVKPPAKAVAVQSQEPASLQAPKPKAQPNAVATAAAKPAPKTDPSAKPAEQAAATPQETNTAQADAEGTDTATTADASLAEPLTRRQRRLLRRQQREQEGQEPVLPWLR